MKSLREKIAAVIENREVDSEMLDALQEMIESEKAASYLEGYDDGYGDGRENGYAQAAVFYGDEE